MPTRDNRDWDKIGISEDERSIIVEICRLHDQLRSRYGWRHIMYSPKDGSRFLAIEPTSSGVHDCYYHGKKWPDGAWWVNGQWPSLPSMFKPYPKGYFDEEAADD